MRIRSAVLEATLLVLLALLVGACQQPGDTPFPAGSAAPAPGESPVGPAIEPEASGPESPLATLPPGEPVAPAIEPEPTGPDPTVGFDPG